MMLNFEREGEIVRVDNNNSNNNIDYNTKWVMFYFLLKLCFMMLNFEREGEIVRVEGKSCYRSQDNNLFNTLLTK